MARRLRLGLLILLERYGAEVVAPRSVEQVARDRGIPRARVRELEGVALREVLRQLGERRGLTG